jgi:hypothetical protein
LDSACNNVGYRNNDNRGTQAKTNDKLNETGGNMPPVGIPKPQAG